MASSMFLASYNAFQVITRTFDIVWALDAGLWNFRNEAKRFFKDNPDASNAEARNNLVKDLDIHGLNPYRIAKELSWQDEEQYISELLLINACAIFDTWVDSFVNAVFHSTSSAEKKKIKDDTKKGDFSRLNFALSNEPGSSLGFCFNITTKRQDAYIDNLRLVYKYFKSCRNCCAHGNRLFSSASVRDYTNIKGLTKSDCGLKEFPSIIEAKINSPLKLILRGVVGFYDILIRIIGHYDSYATEKIAVEAELLIRCKELPLILESRDSAKKLLALQRYMESINICPIKNERVSDVYNFFVLHNLIS